MKISPYSLLSSVVFSSLYLSALCIFRSRFRFKKKSHVTIFSILYLFGFLRLFLPIDFTFTKGIQLEGVFSHVWKYLFAKMYRVFEWEFYLIEIVLFVMIFFSVFRIFYFIKGNRIATAYMNIHLSAAPKSLEPVFEKVRSEFPKIEAEIVFSEVIGSPFTTGLLHKKIVIPDMDLTEMELECILRHEFTHIKRHDLMKKWFLSFFGIVFWWIPFNSFLCRDIEQLMEIHCDNQATSGLSMQEKALYMRNFFNITKKISLSRSADTVSMCFILQENHDAVMERFKIMANSSKGNFLTMGCYTLLAVFLLFATYMIAAIPKIEPSNSDYGENSIVLETDVTYVLFKDNAYYMISSDMEPIPLEPEEAECLIINGFILKEE